MYHVNHLCKPWGPALTALIREKTLGEPSSFDGRKVEYSKFPSNGAWLLKEIGSKWLFTVALGMQIQWEHGRANNGLAD